MVTSLFINRNKSDEVPDKHLNPVKVLMRLEEVLTENTILIGDGGDFVATAAYILRLVFRLAYKFD